MAAPFVQRGFELPSGFSSFLADIPEQHGEAAHAHGQAMSHSQGQSNCAPDAFIVPHFRAWNGNTSGSGNGASPVSDHQQHQSLHAGSHGATATDDLTDVLRNFINLDGNANSAIQHSGNNPSSPKSSQVQSIYDFHGYRQLQSASSFYNAFQQLPPHMQSLPSPNTPGDMPQSPAPLMTNMLSEGSRGNQPGTSNPASGFPVNSNDIAPTRAFSSAFSPASFNQPLPSPSLHAPSAVDEVKDADSRGSSRPNSNNEVRGRRTSPSDEKSRGRNSSAGRAPVQRPSRSRTRKPSYSRTISPGQTSLRNSTGPGGSTLGGSTNTTETGGTGSNGASAVTSPYLPGYPPMTGQNARFGSSVPTYLNGPGSVPQNWSGNGYPFGAFQHHRRPSDASTFAPSSLGADGSPYIGTAALPQADPHHNAMGMASVAGSAPAGLVPQKQKSGTPVDDGDEVEEERGRS